MPGLGRKPAFDQQSRAFGILAIEDRDPRSYTWGCDFILNQGIDPHCVGFSWAGELGARPVVLPVGNEAGRVLFSEAQLIDREEGRYWEEGASVLAGAKAVHRRGHMPEYRWAFGVDQLAVGVSWTGPAVIGVDWHDNMFHPDPQGYIRPEGSLAGGHAILVRGYNVKLRRFTLQNSWGREWGKNGSCFVAYDDMNYLLQHRGDACIPVRRKK